MRFQEVLVLAKSLSKDEQMRLVVSLQQSHTNPTGMFTSRCHAFINKQESCPHCDGKHYFRYGKMRGLQRFKCKSCDRTFTEYTGTWLDGIHKKALAEPYMSLMLEQYSLDKIVDALHINKKTAFDWRHKILSSCEQDKGSEFEGVVESDETFFEHSEKGNQYLGRASRKRGTDPKKRGISTDKAAVIVSADRNKSLKMTLSTMGRITKSDIAESFQGLLPEKTILCSDGHVSYKGFCKDRNLKHIVLRTDLKQYIKKGGYHIQHVNELHNRLKKWISNTFWGVSTKYLQSYLNWFYISEKFKNKGITAEKMAHISLQNAHAIKQYRYNDFAYNVLLTTQN